MSSSRVPEGSLQDRVVVVTRAPDRAAEMVGALEARGARVVVFPTIELKPIDDTRALDAALADLDTYALVLFGSKSAAELVLERAKALGVEIRCPVACVGKKTQAFVAPRISSAVVAPEVYRAEALVDHIAALLGDLSGRRFLFPRAPEGREVIMELIEARGGVVDAVPVYRIEARAPAEPEAVASLEGADAFTFLSGETLRAFLEVVPEDVARAQLERSVVAVIGPVAQARADALGIRVDVVPETATVEALVAALAAHLGPKV